MDTLPTGSVSIVKVHGFHSASRELCHFKTTPSTSNLLQQPYLYCSATKPNLISNKTTTSVTSKPFGTPIFLSPSPTLSSSFTSSSPTLHRKPATGYAAALLDTAQSKSCIGLVENDVQRFLKLLQNKEIQYVLADPLKGEKVKGQVLMGVANKGEFSRHLVGLVKMLVKKNKASILKQVLDEFQRIYDELCGTQVVLVSSANKLGEEQLYGIAKRVQSLTGAVKVRIRNLVHDNSTPSFAV
ncbi:hypothetical protein FNV43_RR18098 [Rhamnella rubrinervis]|uniref:ATP synthase subunit O, mitochondrial n=1 Tax=Rhamnella rubrinervis TaxID=2594499 RepID=A0A8K0DYS3_9ROSA|nr:hypothetical protein FNV43_RR18098 [Rhamnella rubrinervis]